MTNNFILSASRDENKNLVFTSAAGTVFDLVSYLDESSIRKVKQAISFKQNVKITYSNGDDGEFFTASATKSPLTKVKPADWLLPLSEDYVEPTAEVSRAKTKSS